MTLPTDLVTDTVDSPLGAILLAASGRGLAGLWFEGQRHWPAQAARWRTRASHPLLAQAELELAEYFSGGRRSFDVALDLAGATPFQARVWQALRAIPAGATASYAGIAQAIGAPTAMRAVGAAIGRNPVSILVPCHRVIGAGGALTGYAGGLDRKTALLRLEGALH